MDSFLLITSVLATVQILMAYQIRITAVSQGRNMALNGRKESLNQNGMKRVQEMWTVVAFCCVRTTNWPFSSLSMVFFSVSFLGIECELDSNFNPIGKPIPINPSVRRLYPTVTVWKDTSLESNFGDDPTKPFRYDIAKCPRLAFP
jgi:hypothetical protein